MSLIILTVQKRDRLGEKGVEPGGKHSPMARYREAPPERGYLFQALGVWKCRGFTSWSIEKRREICHLRLWKGPNGLTDEFYQFYGFVKSRKHSLIFVIDSYLKNSAFTPVKRDAKFQTRYVKGVPLSKEGKRKQGRIQGEAAGGVHPPPQMTCGFLIQLVFCKKKKKLCGLLVLK